MQSRFCLKPGDSILSPYQLMQLLKATLSHRDHAVYTKGGRKSDQGTMFIQRLSAFFEKLAARVNTLMTQLGVDNDESGVL
jgi:hypothetical protein